MSLLSLALPVAGRLQGVLLVVGLAGASLFFGDAMITPGHLGAERGRGSGDRASRRHALRRPPGGGDPGGVVRDPEEGQRRGRLPVRAGDGSVVRRAGPVGACPPPEPSRGASGPRSPLRRGLRRPRGRGDLVPGPRFRVPGPHRRRGALRRHGAFRPVAHPPRLVRPRDARPGPELPRPGRVRAGRPGRGRQSLLPAVPGLAADPRAAADDRCHRSSPARPCCPAPSPWCSRRSNSAPCRGSRSGRRRTSRPVRSTCPQINWLLAPSWLGPRVRLPLVRRPGQRLRHRGRGRHAGDDAAGDHGGRRAVAVARCPRLPGRGR